MAARPARREAAPPRRTIRLYLKGPYARGGAAAINVPAVIQEFCRHVQYIKVFLDGAPVAIRDTWNTASLRVVDVTNVPFKFDLRLGLSDVSVDFFASNAGFLISRTADQISPALMPRNIGGEINFYPGVVDLNMARDTIIENDKAKAVRRLVSKAIKNLLIRVANEGNPDELKKLRAILVSYLELALKHEERVKARDSAPPPEDDGPEPPPLNSIEAAELLMDVWEVEIREKKVNLREGLRLLKEDGKDRVYISNYSSRKKQLFKVIEESLRKRGFGLMSLDTHAVQFKSGRTEYVSERDALDYLAKRYYFNVYQVEKPFSADIEDLTISKEMLSPPVRKIIDEIESSTGGPVHLSRLKGAPVVFELAGANYLNVGSDLFNKALALFEAYDKAVLKSYILGLLRYEIR